MLLSFSHFNVFDLCEYPLGDLVTTLGRYLKDHVFPRKNRAEIVLCKKSSESVTEKKTDVTI